MTTQSPQHNGDLFYKTLIQSYVDRPHFVERQWLSTKIENALSDPNCRFLLLTAEPGAGKTAFMAWLASQHHDWPRYFTRRDSQTPLSSGDAHSFLFALGHQLAAQRPMLFQPDELEIVVEQRIGELASGGKAVAITIEDLRVSPFYRTSLKVKQHAKIVAGDLEGINVAKMVAEKRFLEWENLQYLALLDPAKVLLKEEPDAMIVILIDALDELRYHHGKDHILNWLANCPVLPPNIRFIITSRPEDLLNIFKQRQQMWFKEEIIDTKSEQVQTDLQRYAEYFTTQESVKQILAEYEKDSSEFVTQAVKKADGNFQYLAALLRGIEKTIEQNKKDQLKQLLRFENVPVGLENLYAFFLTQIKNNVFSEKIKVPGETLFEEKYAEVWGELYQPILGILAVAREPLDARQIKGFIGFQGDERYLYEALEPLGQFLDHLDKRYRLYHTTFAEFLTSSKTQVDYSSFYLDPVVWHHEIIAYYRGKSPTWDKVDWSKVDTYGLFHLPSHLYALRDLKVRDIPVYRQELYGLICKSFMREKHVRFGSHQSFASDVNLVIEAALSDEPPNLVEEMRLVLINATLKSLATNVPPEVLANLVHVGGVEVLANLVHVGGVEIALDYASLIHDELKQIQAYRLIGEALLENKVLEKSIDIFKQAVMVFNASIENKEIGSDTVYSLVELIENISKSLVKSGQFQEALLLAEMVNHKYGRVVILSRIVQEMAKLGEKERLESSRIAKKALNIYETSEDEHPFHSTIVEISLSKALAQLGEFDNALIIAEKLDPKRVYRSYRKIFMNMAETLAELGEFDRALSVAENITRTYGGEFDKTRTQIRIMQTMVKLGHSEKAIEIAENIQEEPHKSVALSVALSEISKLKAQLGEKVEADQLGNRALEVAEKIKDYDYLFFVSMVQSNVTQAFSHIGEFDKALELEEKITFYDYAIKKEAFSELMKKLVLFGKKAEVDEILNRWLTEVKNWGEDQHDALTFLAQLMAQLENKDGLNRILKVAENGEQKSAVCWIAPAIAHLGEFDKALELAEVMEDRYPEKNEALREIAQEMAKKGERERAIEVAKTAIATAEAMKDYKKYQYDSLNWGVQFMLQLDEKEKATQITNLLLGATETLEDDRDKFVALRDIALTFTEIGDKEKAIHIINRAEVVAENIGDTEDKETSREEIAQILTEAGDLDRVLKLAEKQKYYGWRDYTFSEITTALAQTGDLDRALEFVEKIHKDYNADSISKLVVKMAEVGDLDRAMGLVEKVDNWHEKMDVLRELSEKMAEIGEFDRALELVDTIEDEEKKAKALIGIALFMAQSGDKARAAQIAYTMLEMIEKSRFDKDYILKMIAYVMAELGEIKRALEVADKVENYHDNKDVFYKITQTLVQMGYFDLAIETTAKIEDKYFKIDVLIEVAHVLAQSDKRSRAIEVVNMALLAVEKIEEISKIDPLIKVAHAMAQLNERSRAIEVVNMALLAVEKIEDKKSKIENLIKVAHAMAQLDERTRAIEVSEKALAVLKTMEKFGTFGLTTSKIHEEIFEVADLTQIMSQIVEFNEAHLLDKLQEQAFSVWKSEFAKIQSREYFFKELRISLPFIASIDQGQTLWNLYETILEVDSWWSAGHEVCG